jgi:hypothetical protein
MGGRYFTFDVSSRLRTRPLTGRGVLEYADALYTDGAADLPASPIQCRISAHAANRQGGAHLDDATRSFV